MLYLLTRVRSYKTNKGTVKREFLAGFSPIEWTTNVDKAVIWSIYEKADGYKKFLYARQGKRTYNYIVEKEEKYERVTV